MTFSPINPDEARDLLAGKYPVLREGQEIAVTPGVRGSGSVQDVIDEVLNAPTQQSEPPTLLLQPAYGEVPLNAYLASALTGLSPADRDEINSLSDMASVVCKMLEIELYEPRKNADPELEDGLSAREVFNTDKHAVENSDLLIGLTNYPSFGAGQEFEIAFNSMIPILLIVRSGKTISRMVRGIPGTMIIVEYSDPTELRNRLEFELKQIRPLLVQRKIILDNFSMNIVGERIRGIRKANNLTAEDLAVSLGVDSAQVEHWERSTDRENNFSLVQLRQIAARLNISVAQLVEPSMDSVCIAYFRDILDSRSVAARWGRTSREDRKALLKLIFNRFGYELGLGDD